MEQTSPLVCPSHKTQYITAVIVGVLLGSGVTFLYLNRTPNGMPNTYKAGFEDAKKRLEASPAGMVFRTPDDIRTISGSVVAISGNRLTIKTQSMNPLEDPALAERVVTIASGATIVKISRDMAAFQAQMEAFMKSTQSGKGTGVKTPPTPPEPVRTTVDASQIAVGNTITVTATENIKSAKEFTASDIQIQ